MTDQVLIHHGVKGMKWGVRRYRNKDGSLTAEGKAHAQQQAERNADKARRADYKQAAKNRRNLSDEELLARIGRLEKEKRLKELTEDNLSNNRVRSTGEKAVNDVLVGSGKKVATIMLAGGAMYVGNALLTGEIDPKKAAGYLFPNPNKKK